MPPILKRILANGLLTAGVLAIIGFGYAELAGVYLMTRTPSRGTFDGPVPAARAEDPVASQLRYRVPAMMALWGFVFIAAGEGVLHFWRRHRAAVVALSTERKPDPAELLLEQIMAQVEAAKAAPAEPAPSPSSLPAENSPVA
jgi:hypothetical protein